MGNWFKKATIHTTVYLVAVASVLILITTQCSPKGQPSTSPNAAHRFETSIQQFEQQDQNTPVNPGGILFVGSSSIRGWQSLEQYFGDYDALNRGFGGSELSDVLYYFDRVVVPYHPRQIFLYEGDNDVVAGKSPEMITTDFRTFVAMVRQKLPGTPVVFISIKPSAARKRFIKKMADTNRLIKAYCDSRDDLTFVDIFYPMLDQHDYPRPELFKADSLHMVQKGYDLWESIIEPYLMLVNR